MKKGEHVGSFSCRKGGVISRSVGGTKGLKIALEMHSRSWAVSCRSGVGQPTGDRQATEPSRFHFQNAISSPDLEVSVSRQVTKPFRSQFQNVVFPVLMGRLALNQHAANRPDQCRLADCQPIGDRLYPEILK